MLFSMSSRPGEGLEPGVEAAGAGLRVGLGRHGIEGEVARRRGVGGLLASAASGEREVSSPKGRRRLSVPRRSARD